MIAVLLLALCLLLLAAAVLSLALLVSRRARRAVENRVDLVFAITKAESDEASESVKTPQAPTLTGEKLRAFFSFGTANRWGMHSRPALLMLLAGAASTLVMAGSVYAMQLPPVIGIPLGLAAALFLPRFLLLREQSQAERQFTNLFPDAVDMCVRMLRAGLPISSAIRATGAEAPTPVDGVFKAVGDQLEIGIPFDEALATTAERVAVPDFRFFSVAAALQRATGGNLATTLEILSDIMRKRRAVRLKAQATTAEVRVSAYILGAIPFFVTGVLLLAQPGYLAPLLSDPRGKFIIGAATASLIVGFMIMGRMMRHAVRV